MKQRPKSKKIPKFTCFSVGSSVCDKDIETLEHMEFNCCEANTTADEASWMSEVHLLVNSMHTLNNPDEGCSDTF